MIQRQQGPDRPRQQASVEGSLKSKKSRLVLLFSLLLLFFLFSFARTVKRSGLVVPTASTDSSTSRLETNNKGRLGSLPIHPVFTFKSQSVPILSAVPSPTTLQHNAFCLPWSINSDVWWTHNVAYEVFYEDDDYYCFALASSGKIRRLQHLYTIQFPANSSDCTTTNSQGIAMTKPLSNSGFGMDLMHVMVYLDYAAQNNRSMQFKGPWHVRW